MQRLVAVKISEDHGSEPQTLAQLDHDYIVRVFDQRLLEGGALRLLYMQYLPGGTLLGVVKAARQRSPDQRSGRLLLDVVDQALADKGEIRPTDSAVRAEIASLTWPETVAWLGRRLADALDYAGSHGVLHRDIKPANVLLTADGVPKLADFNISFSTETSGDSPVAYFGGSLSYMSPEQLSAIHPDRPGTAADMDTRSDLYSLGVVLWEFLAGTKPFADGTGGDAGDRTTLDAMLERRSHGVVPHPRDDLPADCPTTLSRVLSKALEPDPADRWSSGNELAQQLDVCLDPRARDLVDPPKDSWRERLRRWPHPIMALAIAVPNLLAIVYSYHHNKTLIIDKLARDAQDRFDLLTRWSYLIAFPTGFPDHDVPDHASVRRFERAGQGPVLRRGCTRTGSRRHIAAGPAGGPDGVHAVGAHRNPGPADLASIRFIDGIRRGRPLHSVADRLWRNSNRVPVLPGQLLRRPLPLPSVPAARCGELRRRRPAPTPRSPRNALPRCRRSGAAVRCRGCDVHPDRRSTAG